MTVAHEPAATAAAIPCRPVTMTPDEALQSDHGPAMHALALALLAQRRFDDAVAAGLRASQLLPPAERRHVLYARLLVALEQRAHAVVILRAWLAQGPATTSTPRTSWRPAPARTRPSGPATPTSPPCSTISPTPSNARSRA